MAKDRIRDEPPSERPLMRAATYPTSRLSPPFELVELAREIEQADAALGMVVGAQLEVIREQMRALQEKARRVL